MVSDKAWELGIAEGVRQGLFGLGILEDERPVCRYFKEEPFIGLAGSEVIIQAEVCQAQREAAEPGYEAPDAAKGAPSKETKVGALKPEPGATVGPGTGGGGATLRRRLRMRFTVPKGKVAGLMGVMNLLQHKFNRLEVVLSAEQGWISEQEYDDKISEAFRQLGIEVVEERAHDRKAVQSDVQTQFPAH